jgi:RimJ/RimL family protein N-acetyltransferase
MIPVLTTERLTLRGPRLADFEPVAAFLASDRARYVGGPYHRLHAWRALAAVLGHWELRGYGMWAVEESSTGDLAGIIGVHNPEGWLAPEIGWWMVSPAHEGRGFAFEAAVVARRYAYTIVGWREAFSVIDPDNLRSIRLAERLGCRLDREDVTPTDKRVLVFRHPAPEARP